MRIRRSRDQQRIGGTAARMRRPHSMRQVMLSIWCIRPVVEVMVTKVNRVTKSVTLFLMRVSGDVDVDFCDAFRGDYYC